MIEKDVLKRNLPGIPSQRLRRAPRKPVVSASPYHPAMPAPECPVSDTYADGVPATDGSIQGEASDRGEAGKEFESYTLTIMGSRRSHFSFDTLDELKEELRQYLSPSEIRNGVFTRLTTFDLKRVNGNGYVENKWQYFSTCAYPVED